jgi:hypothetical protein
MKRCWLLLGGICLIAIALAQSGYRLMINGKAAEGSAITVKGETYVPLKALQAAGVKASIEQGTLRLTFAAEGGANQNGALEGGINDWLFNGVWRFRVLSVSPIREGGSGWAVKVELRNGTKTDQLSLAGTGFDSLKLVLTDGALIDVGNVADIRDKGYPQGAGEIVTLVFNVDEVGSGKPDRLLLILKPDADLRKYMRESLKATYSVNDPSFRVKLGGG